MSAEIGLLNLATLEALAKRTEELNSELQTLLKATASAQQVKQLITTTGSILNRTDVATSTRASDVQARQIITSLSNLPNPTNQLNNIQNTLNTVNSQTQNLATSNQANNIYNQTGNILTKVNALGNSSGAVKSIQQVRVEASNGNMTGQSFRDSGNGNSLNGRGRTVSIDRVYRPKSMALLTGCMWSGSSSNPGVVVSLPDSASYVSTVHFVVMPSENFFIAQAVIIEFN